MSFFKSLADIGISRSELTDIGNENIIRIEKKLLAEQRLNSSVSRNDIEQILKVIKNYPDVLKIVCSYDCFYGILTGYDAEHIDTLKLNKPEQTARIRFVVSEFFRDEILAYLNVNVNDNNWNNVRVLLYYRLFFTKDITDAIARRLEGRIEHAIGIMQQEPAYKELKTKINYLKDPEFYVLLSELDSRNFESYIYKLLDFLDWHVQYVREEAFFEKMLRAFGSFDTTNRPLKMAIGKAFIRYRRPDYVPGLVVVSVFVVIPIFLFILLNIRHPNKYPISLDSWSHSKTQNTGNNEEYQSPLAIDADGQSDMRAKMTTFVEARINTLNYPLNSWKTNERMTKYESPFSLDIFTAPNQRIKQTRESIAIFNQTDNDCVAIAYFRNQYDRFSDKYIPMERNGPPEIYAVYIPAGDSISVDFKMYLLRFYMGKRPAKFNTYQRYIYPDSLDMKFSKFTNADSLLFNKAFVFGEEDNVKQKQPGLIITQPNNKSYQIAWTGQKPLRQYISAIDQIMKQKTNDTTSLDSATKKKPLLFVVKPDANNQNISPNEAINTYLNWGE